MKRTGTPLIFFRCSSKSIFFHPSWYKNSPYLSDETLAGVGIGIYIGYMYVMMQPLGTGFSSSYSPVIATHTKRSTRTTTLHFDLKLLISPRTSVREITATRISSKAKFRREWSAIRSERDPTKNQQTDLLKPLRNQEPRFRRQINVFIKNERSPNPEHAEDSNHNSELNLQEANQIVFMGRSTPEIQARTHPAERTRDLVAGEGEPFTEEIRKRDSSILSSFPGGFHPADGRQHQAKTPGGEPITQLQRGLYK